MKKGNTEKGRLDALVALPLDEKKTACIYEAYRYLKGLGMEVGQTGEFSPIIAAYQEGLSYLVLVHWFELERSDRAIMRTMFNLELSVDTIRIRGFLDKSRLEVYPPDEWKSVLILNIDWPQGIGAILEEIERIVLLYAPPGTPGKGGKPDPRHRRGRRVKSGEFDPAFRWLAVQALLDSGCNVSETARRLGIDRATVIRSKSKLMQLLVKWFDCGSRA